MFFKIRKIILFQKLKVREEKDQTKKKRWYFVLDKITLS